MPPLEFGGPGYDALMPHDLQHLIVESELGLQHGVFGFMAAGGQSGGSPHLAAGEDRRAAARRRAKGARRDKNMLRDGGRDEGPLSERATYLCWYEWLRRSRDPALRERAASMAEMAKKIFSVVPDHERKLFTEGFFARTCARMDELSTQWRRLAIGESFSVPWTVRAARRASAGRNRKAG